MSYLLPNLSHWHPSWLSNVPATKKDPQSECLARANLETNPINIKPETVSGRAVLLGCLTLLLSAQGPLPNKVSCLVSTCISLDNPFPSGNEPPFRPWKRFPLAATRGGFKHSRGVRVRQGLTLSDLYFEKTTVKIYCREKRIEARGR